MRNKIISIMMMFVMSLSFTGCGSDNPSETNVPEVSSSVLTDSQFADLIRENTDDFDASSDANIVAAAEAGCEYMDAGATFEEVATAIIESGVDPEDGGFLLGAGTERYCPEHLDVISNYSN